MIPTTIRSPPSLADYTPLADYQAQTPETFHGGPPVIYYHATGAKAWLPKSERGSLPFFSEDFTSEPTGPEGGALNGLAEEHVERVVDLYVSSESFTIFCPDAACGVSIPYPTISLHALKNLGDGEPSSQSVFLQLELRDADTDDDSIDTVELTLIPPAGREAGEEDGSAPPRGEASKLFEAISECSNLHPDPDDEEGDDEDDEFGGGRIVFEGDLEPVEGFTGVFAGGSGDALPPPMPGSSGWITAENVHEYFDEEGNWIGDGGVSGELGEGAGRVRARDEAESAEGDGQGQIEDHEGDNKRPRTE
ncbi:hypothetical protein VTK73DRAFT_3599 [Phialemonium thermophilum]|uniref:Uncharacterized protein n=1 Tax=Phialemonium thermophilum TaxID=223376 RepID=A0ABR3VGV2_9PEZI